VMANPLFAKRCPFCKGVRASVSIQLNGRDFAVECPNCGANGPTSTVPESAAEKWNSFITDRIRELEAENAELKAHAAELEVETEIAKGNALCMLQEYTRVANTLDAGPRRNCVPQLNAQSAADDLPAAVAKEMGGNEPSSKSGDSSASRAAAPVCKRCNDTHRMTLHSVSGEERLVMCTACPIPCQKCRAGGNGPFCENTPCPCECHFIHIGNVGEIEGKAGSQ